MCHRIARIVFQRPGVISPGSRGTTDEDMETRTSAQYKIKYLDGVMTADRAGHAQGGAPGGKSANPMCQVNEEALAMPG